MTTDYEVQREILREEIDAINARFDLPDRGLTFGYIGNAKLGPKGWDTTDCLWFVFLPHPGRVGKADDRLGGFTEGDTRGIVECRKALKALARGMELAKGIA
jgi:hypothetical protein